MAAKFQDVHEKGCFFFNLGVSLEGIPQLTVCLRAVLIGRADNRLFHLRNQRIQFKIV